MIEREIVVMMFWPLMVVATVAVVLLAVVAGGPRLFHGTRRRSESLRCPVLGREVTADFEVSEQDSSALCVHACSAFTPPSAVRCDRRCVWLRGAPGQMVAPTR